MFGLGFCCVPNKKDLVILGPQVATWSFTRAAFAKKGQDFHVQLVGRSVSIPPVSPEWFGRRLSGDAPGMRMEPKRARKFVVFPLERRWCLIPKKPEMLGSLGSTPFSRCFFKLPIVLKKQPRTGSTLAACPENSEVCLWTSVPLAKKLFCPNPRCSMGLAVFTYVYPQNYPVL